MSKVRKILIRPYLQVRAELNYEGRMQLKLIDSKACKGRIWLPQYAHVWLRNTTMMEGLVWDISNQSCQNSQWEETGVAIENTQVSVERWLALSHAWVLWLRIAIWEVGKALALKTCHDYATDAPSLQKPNNIIEFEFLSITHKLYNNSELAPFFRRFCCHGYNGINICKITFPTYSCHASNVLGNDSRGNIKSTDGSNKGNLRNISRDVFIHLLNRTGKIFLYKIYLKLKTLVFII